MKILLVCSEFFAGMMPYGASLVNIMQQGKNEIFGVFVYSDECDYRKEIDNADNGNFIFLPAPKNIFERELFRISATKVYRAIKKICASHKIDVIHFLTEDSSLAVYVNLLKRKHTVVYTVHDLKAHEEKLKGNILKYLIRYFFVTRRVRYLINTSNNLVTNSKAQYALLQKDALGNKKAFFHNFPSLVTNIIKSGNKELRELSGTDNYILFFGRVEPYKGVDILYKEYIENAHLHSYPLVIAGSGKIYFERYPEKEKNIIFINRYIADEEVNSLFKNAGCVVYPYSSATQSGVVSLAFHFNKPVIVSNIPFLKDCVENAENAYVFDIDDRKQLSESILSAMTNETPSTKRTDTFSSTTIQLQLEKNIRRVVTCNGL